jgi:hypothetical protein
MYEIRQTIGEKLQTFDFLHQYKLKYADAGLDRVNIKIICKRDLNARKQIFLEKRRFLHLLVLIF